MTLPSIARSLQNKLNNNDGHSSNKVKSLSFHKAESKSDDRYETRLKIILVYLMIIIALSSIAINYWAPIEKFLLSVLKY